MNYTLASDKELLSVLHDDFATDEDKKQAAKEIMTRKGDVTWELRRELQGD